MKVTASNNYSPDVTHSSYSQWWEEVFDFQRQWWITHHYLIGDLFHCLKCCSKGIYFFGYRILSKYLWWNVVVMWLFTLVRHFCWRKFNTGCTYIMEVCFTQTWLSPLILWALELKIVKWFVTHWLHLLGYD